MLGLKLVGAFTLCACIFRILENRGKDSMQRHWSDQSLHVDVMYWFITPMATTLMMQLTVSGTLALAVILIGEQIAGNGITTLNLLGGQPVAIQIAVGLFFGDLLYYLMHRLFHCRLLWPFHSVHHSSKRVNWLSAVRLHPVNNYLMRLTQAIFALFIGLDPEILGVVVAFLYFYAVLIHADLDWDYGRLRLVFVSPAYHRWHHTQEGEARDRNFAGLFPFWDLLFGTLYFPKNRRPANFGTHSPVPDGFWKQQVFPFLPRQATTVNTDSES